MSRPANNRASERTANVSCPEGVRIENGDLILSAPSGRIIIDAGAEVQIRSAASIRVDAQSIDLTAARSSVIVDDVTIVAKSMRRTADHVIDRVARIELQARRVTHDVGEYVRRISSLHTTVDRVRLIARDAMDLLARRTTIVSEEDTTIDGKRVLLG